MARFQNGVLDKRQPGLFGGFHAQIGLRDHVQAEIGQQVGKFAHFARVTGGKNDFCIMTTLKIIR